MTQRRITLQSDLLSERLTATQKKREKNWKHYYSKCTSRGNKRTKKNKENYLATKLNKTP